MAKVRISKTAIIAGAIDIRPLKDTASLTIGAYSFLNVDTRMACRGGIYIGDYVQIGARVSLETVTHEIRFVSGRRRGDILGKIHIEDHVWIGTGAIILPGVTVGRGAVIAAGAVVHRDVAPMTVVGGVPARLIRDLKSTEYQDDICEQSVAI